MWNESPLGEIRRILDLAEVAEVAEVVEVAVLVCFGWM